MRRSELLGLRWSAIDFRKGTLTISTTVVREKQGNEIVAVVRENTTKSDSSMRTLPLCQYTYQYFSWLRQQQATQRDLCGGSYDQRFLDFVCVDQIGRGQLQKIGHLLHCIRLWTSIPNMAGFFCKIGHILTNIPMLDRPLKSGSKFLEMRGEVS